MSDDARQIHATAIALDGRAALVLGASGAGKSDLALRCLLQGAWIDNRHCLARLVADDQVIVTRAGAELMARAPATIAGRLEVRGLGLMDMPYVSEATIALCVEIAAPAMIERLPDPPPSWQFLGVALPLIRVAPHEASAHLKVLLALVHGLPAA